MEGRGAMMGEGVFLQGYVGGGFGMIVALLALGNVLAALYALLAAARSRGDWSRFWLGRRAPGSG